MDDRAVDAFRHLGGGRKGLFVVLRYVFIITAAYLVVFQNPGEMVSAGPALMIAIALASNVTLSMLRSEYLFSWYIEAPILVADTIWVSWALHQTGASGQELFLLYFFVLFLAMVGEKPLLAIFGSTAVSVANLYFTAETSVLTSRSLLQVVFFYAVALFYGHVMSQVKHERRRADRGFAWARELEAVVEQRTRELRRLYGNSVEANRLKDEFVANMSHELRTPLNIIMGYADMLLDGHGLTEADRLQLLGRVRDAAGELKHLVDGVLDLGKLEAGRVPVTREPLALDAWIADMRQRQRLSLAPGVRLDWRVSPGLPTIETDEPKLRIVLDNLVNNAIKFTVHGAVTVSLGVTEGDGQVQLTVDDTGPGIPASDLCRIFEPFHQGEVASNGAHGGVGLGLTIVNRYVILLGGRLDVSSVVGSGSTFMVTLPITTPERDRVLTPRDESPAPSPTITVFEPESRRRPRAA